MIEMMEYRSGRMARIVSDPRLFDEQDKSYANSQGYEYVCRCMPDKDLRYRFSKDLKLYPVHKDTIASGHSPKCPFSDQYDKNQTAKKGEITRDQETGEIRTAVFEDITKPLSRYNVSESSSGSSSETSDDNKGKNKILRVIKDLNFIISQKQATAFHRKIRDIHEYNRWLFQKAKDTCIEGRGMLNSPTKEIRFIYEVLKDISATVKQPDGTSKEYRLSDLDYDAAAFHEAVQKNGYRCQMETFYKNKAGEGSIKTTWCTPIALDSGLKAFIKEYGSEDARPVLSVKDGCAIVTGFEYGMQYTDKSGMVKQTRKAGRLWFFLASGYGPYIQDEGQSEMYHAVFSAIKDMENVRFYVDDISSPYGVVTMDECPVKLIVGYASERKSAAGSDDLSLKYDPDDADGFKTELKDKLQEMQGKIR